MADLLFRIEHQYIDNRERSLEAGKALIVLDIPHLMKQ
jgi:hypothetical protein